MNSRWLLRAAGTVGLAGGFLLLAGGGAQADSTDTDGLDALAPLLDEAFSPTAGLPAPAGWGAEPELLPAVPALPALPDVSSLLGGGLPLGGALDGAGVDPQIGLLPPLDGLLNIDGQLVGLPTRFTPALPFEAVEQEVMSADPTGAEELVGPALLRPFTDSLLGSQAAGALAPVSSLTGQVPVAGPLVHQYTNSLPIVADLMAVDNPHQPPVHPGQPQGPAPMPAGAPMSSAPMSSAPMPGDMVAPAGDPLAGDPLAGPAPAGPEVPAVIGQELAQEFGLAAQPEVIGGLPLLGPALEPALEPVGRLVGVGNLAQQVPLVGPLAGSAVGDLPVISSAAPGGAGLPLPAGLGGTEHDRPVAGDDPVHGYGYGYGTY